MENKNLRGRSFELPPTVSEAYLVGADVSGASLRRATLLRADLRNARLEDADLYGADLTGALLDDCHAEGANFENATLDQVVALGGRFRRARLDSTWIRQQASFTKCDFRETTWSDAGVAKCDFAGSRFDEARMTNADFQETDLTDSSWERAEMKFGNLERCDLTRAVFVDADLSDTSLMYSNLAGARLRGARLRNAIFDHSRLHQSAYEELRIVLEEEERKYDVAEGIYRALKNFFNSVGFYSVSAEFHYRERVMDRKKRRYVDGMRYVSAILDFCFGYGERPFRLLGLWMVVVGVFAAGVWMLSSGGIGAAVLLSAEAFVGFPYNLPPTDKGIRSVLIVESVVSKILVALFVALLSRKTLRG